MNDTAKTIATVSEVDAARQAAIDAAAAADAADEAAAAAAALVTSCVDAIRTGEDQDSTAADLAEKRAHAEWAQHRADAARAAAQAAHAEERRLVHDAALIAGRKLIADHSLTKLARTYGAAVNALIDFVQAYRTREAALAEAMATLSAGNVDIEQHPSGRSFEGTRLELPPEEFQRSVLDIIDHAHMRLGGRSAGGPLEFVVMQHGFGTGWAEPSAVRTAASSRSEAGS